MVRALATHQCDLGSIPGPSVLCGLSLLLVLVLAPRVFLPSPYTQNLAQIQSLKSLIFSIFSVSPVTSPIFLITTDLTVKFSFITIPLQLLQTGPTLLTGQNMTKLSPDLQTTSIYPMLVRAMPSWGLQGTHLLAHPLFLVHMRSLRDTLSLARRHSLEQQSALCGLTALMLKSAMKGRTLP